MLWAGKGAEVVGIGEFMSIYNTENSSSGVMAGVFQGQREVMFWLSFQAALSAFYDAEQGEPAGVGVGAKEPAVLPPQTTPTTSTSKG